MASNLLPFLDKDIVKLLVALLFTAACTILLILFFKTHVGLCIRATGDNEAMVRASSIPVDQTKLSALALSNGIIALTGALIAQYQSFADINSGVGILVVGLASVIIGEVLLNRPYIIGQLIGCVDWFYHLSLYYCAGNQIYIFAGLWTKTGVSLYCSTGTGSAGAEKIAGIADCQKGGAGICCS